MRLCNFYFSFFLFCYLFSFFLSLFFQFHPPSFLSTPSPSSLSPLLCSSFLPLALGDNYDTSGTDGPLLRARTHINTAPIHTYTAHPRICGPPALHLCSDKQ
ncbi:hypothetical protein NL108_014325 [Boleophthalmus pectinirostris]|nr:hypothetical protein NL108_014325 [Boleophthalmus pectinirostris]